MSLLVNIPYVFFFQVNVRLNKVIKERKDETIFSSVKIQVTCQAIQQALLYTLLAVYMNEAKLDFST
jgi:hypothetical protein